MTVKVVRSLEDLEDALAIAANQGECRIKVGNQVAVLVATETLSAYQADDFLSQLVMVQRLDKATRHCKTVVGSLTPMYKNASVLDIHSTEAVQATKYVNKTKALGDQTRRPRAVL